MGDFPLLHPSGLVEWTTDASMRAQWSTTLARGALIVRPRRELSPLEVLELRIDVVGQPSIRLRAEVVRIEPERTMLRVLDGAVAEPPAPIKPAINPFAERVIDVPDSFTPLPGVMPSPFGAPASTGAAGSGPVPVFTPGANPFGAMPTSNPFNKVGDAPSFQPPPKTQPTSFAPPPPTSATAPANVPAPISPFVPVAPTSTPSTNPFAKTPDASSLTLSSSPSSNLSSSSLSSKPPSSVFARVPDEVYRSNARTETAPGPPPNPFASAPDFTSSSSLSSSNASNASTPPTSSSSSSSSSSSPFAKAPAFVSSSTPQPAPVPSNPFARTPDAPSLTSPTPSHPYPRSPDGEPIEPSLSIRGVAPAPPSEPDNAPIVLDDEHDEHDDLPEIVPVVRSAEAPSPFSLAPPAPTLLEPSSSSSSSSTPPRAASSRHVRLADPVDTSEVSNPRLLAPPSATAATTSAIAVFVPPAPAPGEQREPPPSLIDGSSSSSSSSSSSTTPSSSQAPTTTAVAVFAPSSTAPKTTSVPVYVPPTTASSSSQKEPSAPHSTNASTTSSIAALPSIPRRVSDDDANATSRIDAGPLVQAALPVFAVDTLTFGSSSELQAARRDLIGVGAVLARTDAPIPTSAVEVRLVAGPRTAQTRVRATFAPAAPGTVVVVADRKDEWRVPLAELDADATGPISIKAVTSAASSSSSSTSSSTSSIPAQTVTAIVSSLTLPPSGTLTNPITPRGILMQPVQRPVTEADLRQPSMILLLRWLRTTKGVFRVEFTHEERASQTIIVVDGREVRTSTALAAVGKALAEHQWHYTITELARAPTTSTTGRTLHLIVEVIRGLLAGHDLDEVGAAFPHSKDVRLVRAVSAVADALGFSGPAARFVKTNLQGDDNVLGLLRSPIGTRGVWDVLVPLELFGGLTLAAGEPRRQTPREAIAGVHAIVATDPFADKDHFAVLGLHWSCAPTAIADAWARAKRDFGPGGPRRPLDDQIASKALRRIDEAWQILNDTPKRQAYRRATFNLVWPHQATLLVQQAKLAIYRKDLIEARDLLAAAQDISPSPEARVLLDTLNRPT